MKKCNKCLKEKKLERFPKDRRTPDGHGYTCSVCVNNAAKERARERAKERNMWGPI
ncbi:hypothetical protein GCM10009415_49730 [Chitinophaga japonensis]